MVYILIRGEGMKRYTKVFTQILIGFFIVLMVTSFTDCQSKATSSNNNSRDNTIVYVTKSGQKYHRASCTYLRKSKISITLGEAKKEGYTPCSKCNPIR